MTQVDTLPGNAFVRDDYSIVEVDIAGFLHIDSVGGTRTTLNPPDGADADGDVACGVARECDWNTGHWTVHDDGLWVLVYDATVLGLGVVERWSLSGTTLTYDGIYTITVDGEGVGGSGYKLTADGDLLVTIISTGQVYRYQLNDLTETVCIRCCW